MFQAPSFLVRDRSQDEAHDEYLQQADKFNKIYVSLLRSLANIPTEPKLSENQKEELRSLVEKMLTAKDELDTHQ